MMSNLLASDDGREALLVAQRHLLERRLSRFFKRNLVISYNEWKAGKGFTLEALLGELNAHHDEEIIDLYRLLGIVGGLSNSVSDVDIYVDSTNGSDENGDGSESRPYASLWFLQSLPRRIDHLYNILFQSDCSAGELVIDTEFGPNGYLAFVGVGPAEVVAGPFEVAATGLLDGGFGRFFQMTAPFSSDHSGEFIMAIDGSLEGRGQAIHSQHSADTIISLADSFTILAPGDHMNVVRPAVQLSGRFAFCCRNTSGYPGNVRNNARIAFMNLKVRIPTSGNSLEDSILIDNQCAQLMSFCQVIPPDNGSWRIKSELNTQSGESSSAARSQSGITNINNFGSSPEIAGVSCTDTGVNYPLIVEGTARWTSTRGIIDLQKTAHVETVSAERFTATVAHAKVKDCLAQGRDIGSNSGGGLESVSSYVDIDGLIVLKSDNALTLRNNSKISISGVGADPTYSTLSQYGVYFVGSGLVELRDGGSLLTGSVNAIYFATVNPGTAAGIPAAYGYATDGQMSGVKRLGS